jgi:hypothetical protein
MQPMAVHNSLHLTKFPFNCLLLPQYSVVPLLIPMVTCYGNLLGEFLDFVSVVRKYYDLCHGNAVKGFLA